MEDKVTKTGLGRYHELQAKAKGLGITELNVNTELLEAAIAAKLAEPTKEAVPIEPATPTESKMGLTPEVAADIDKRMKYENEAREKFRAERQVQIDRAAIKAKADALRIAIDIPEKPTELELAKARLALDMKKVEVKPSPETVAIESSERGYYRFMNLEQDDAAHTVCPGGKYFINLIPDQIHILSAAHIKLFGKNAVTPVYSRVQVAGVTPGPDTVGQLKEECKRTGSKRRFTFEYLGKAPQDAPFGMVTNMEVLEELNPKEELIPSM